MSATTVGVIPSQRIPTHAEMVPLSAQSALAHLELPRGLMVCLDCDVTWISTGKLAAEATCWHCGESGESVAVAEDMLGKPIIPRLGPGVARQDMALSEGDYCLEMVA